jgi:cysteinyl-tRNA synthetase
MSDKESVSMSKPLNVYNSMSQQKSPFEPIQENKVAMYVCGITVYDYCHIGHARMLVAFDIIYRHLCHLGYEVDYVRNITDVEDKIFARAKENGEDFNALSQRFIDFMHEDERALNITPPKIEPRATEYMAEIITMIQLLQSKGVAYQGASGNGQGDVYFAIDKFEDYGKLSKRKPEELLVGARIEAEKAKNNPLDFVLWKMAKEGEAFWESPWGKGRPGWHIECSAMSTSCLGNSLDIHGGGSDLLFPHHENEIAQSEAATGEEFAKVWMHCGPVRVDKEKMSKSLGNFFTIREVLKDYHSEVIRYFLSASHYRSPINYSVDNLNLAKKELDKFYQAFAEFELENVEASGAEDLVEKFNAAMNDDFNTAQAIAVMFELQKRISGAEPTAQLALAKQLQILGRRLGFLYLNPTEYFQGESTDADLDAPHIETLIQEREKARNDKNWARGDEIRDLLLEKGIALEDSNGKTTWKRK